MPSRRGRRRRSGRPGAGAAPSRTTGSWTSTTSPSPLRWASDSSPDAPSSSARSKAARVFSGRSERAPRWAKVIGLTPVGGSSGVGACRSVLSTGPRTREDGPDDDGPSPVPGVRRRAARDPRSHRTRPRRRAGGGLPVLLPGCEETVTRPASARIVDLLVSAGARRGALGMARRAGRAPRRTAAHPRRPARSPRAARRRGLVRRTWWPWCAERHRSSLTPWPSGW